MENIKTANLSISLLENLNWQKGNRAASLENVYDYVTGETHNTMDWYLSKKGKQRFRARAIRFIAIILTTIAGLIPLISQTSPSQNISTGIEPIWSSIALFLAVAFVGLDKFFGYSNSWIRFVSSELSIRNKLQEFVFDWEIKRAALNNGEPDDAQLLERLELCKNFIIAVNSIVEKEMIQWKNEFQSVLKQIEESTQLK